MRSAIEPESRPSGDLIPLNLIFTYPVNWSRYKVLRDFIQNFFDAVGPDEWKKRFAYRFEEDSLIMEATGVSFSYDWLLHIGASTKRDTDKHYAGFFGEGFKIASLCAIRDHGWTVTMASQDWELEVTTASLKVDQTRLKSLAYLIRKRKTTPSSSTLRLHPFDRDARQVFECAVLSFLFKGNPLLGEEIWSSHSAAVYFRSNVPKPSGYPSTFEYDGSGIVFAGFQAVGSFPYRLVFCVHDYRFKDRDRGSFYRMDVIDAVKTCVRLVSPEAAFQILTVLKDRWYDYPERQYDFETWYGIVHELTEIIGESPAHCREWKTRFPRLLVAKQIRSNELPRKNRRTQALAWMREQTTKYKLVQDGFLQLGYPELERLCEENDGFSLTRMPDKREQKYIELLETVVLAIFQNFLCEEKLPSCQIIKNAKSVWNGMANCVRLSSPRLTPSGNEARFKLPYVALKSHLLRKKFFGEALSTYLHELAHAFGGDKSANFSKAITEILETALIHSQELERFRHLWEKLY